MALDYRDLLMRYINHVGETEGTEFLQDHHLDYNSLFSDVEKAELRRLRDEARAFKPE